MFIVIKDHNVNVNLSDFDKYLSKDPKKFLTKLIYVIIF